MQSSNGTQKGSMTIPFDIHRLRNRHDTDSFGIGIVNDNIMYSNLNATLDLTKSAIEFSKKHTNFMISVLDYKDVHFVSEDSISLVVKYALKDYKHSFNTDLFKIAIWPISLKGLIPTCKDEKQSMAHRDKIFLKPNEN